VAVVVVVVVDISAVGVRILEAAHISAAAARGILVAAHALMAECEILAVAHVSTAEVRVSILEARAFHHSARVNLK
jgi:hypothetical protein